VLSRLPLDEQLISLRAVLSRNEMLTEVISRAAMLGLPGWYVTAGCLCQTVWNVVTGRPPGGGIKDYDIVYFDDGDPSREAEGAVIAAGRERFAGLPIEADMRNEARVHLWGEEKFGVSCAPCDSCEAGIGSFPATTCCLGVRLEAGGRWRVYAPHGLSDVFNLAVRPNPLLAPRAVYEGKAERWRGHWPELTVLKWPLQAPA
jgi:hypothetical protein